MTTAEYRDLISFTSECRASLESAATSHEQRSEALRLSTAADVLREAKCPRAPKDVKEKAVRVLALADELLAQKRAEFKAADANLARMAFGKGW